MKKIFYIFTLIIIVFIISIDIYTTMLIPEHVLSSMKTKTWSHAGYIKGTDLETNTINAFDNAVSNQAKGLELDVFYDTNIKKFIVSHDFPYKKHKNNELLLLSSVFHKYKNDIKFWIDFKNLKDLNSNETKDSCENLKRLLQSESVDQNNILVESTNLENLSYYTYNDFYTSWWIVPSKSKYKSILRDYVYKYYYMKGEFSSISMPFSYYSRVKNHLNNIPINLWTINESRNFEKYLKNKRIKIILSDQNWFLK